MHPQPVLLVSKLYNVNREHTGMVIFVKNAHHLIIGIIIPTCVRHAQQDIIMTLHLKSVFNAHQDINLIRRISHVIKKLLLLQSHNLQHQQRHHHKQQQLQPQQLQQHQQQLQQQPK